MDIDAKLRAGSATVQEALALADALECVDIVFMLGHWHGAGFHTGHPMDGLLETYHWYGKHYASADAAHPLVFSRRNGRRCRVNPALMRPVLRLASRSTALNRRWLGQLFQLSLPLFTTGNSRARLRMTEYRGRSSATMIYDDLPINDVFRKIDDNAVLGVMDMKGMAQPFFFILRRVVAP